MSAANQGANMLYAVTWAMVSLLFIFWSVAAWGLHTAVQWLGGLAPDKLEAATMATGDAAREVAHLLGMPEWVTVSLPPEMIEAWLASVQALFLWLQSILLKAPVLIDSLSPAIWIVWGLGGFVLMLVGIAMHVGIRLFANRSTHPVASVQA
jgi:hypothetical protein